MRLRSLRLALGPGSHLGKGHAPADTALRVSPAPRDPEGAARAGAPAASLTVTSLAKDSAQAGTSMHHPGPEPDSAQAAHQSPCLPVKAEIQYKPVKPPDCHRTQAAQAQSSMPRRSSHLTA